MINLEYLVQHLEVEIAEKKVNPSSLIQCVDLTSLNVADNEQTIQKLCQKAFTYKPAAICVYPAFVLQVAQALKNTNVQVATVANFPEGDQEINVVLTSIEHALKEGATELEVVIPYQAFLASQNTQALKKFVQACKALLSQHKLKIILESGAFHNNELLEIAAFACLEAGADFLKTSTGKIHQGASLMAAAIMINAIQRFGEVKRGFKASGGVRHYAQAKAYYLLAQSMMGESWPNKNTFRIGASSLLDELATLKM